MFNVPKDVKAFSGKLHYVDTCPNSPKTGMAFCDDHCKLLSSHNIPVKLQEYLEYKKKSNVEIASGPDLSAADCQGKLDSFTIFYVGHDVIYVR